ncbi:MAG: hypothetical protein U5R49_24235 [Deltaproteobacteria bacterium]|nr:hypothetical protein [Deltaproteobacteria bacterium]
MKNNVEVSASLMIDQTTVTADKTLTVDSGQTLTIADGEGTDLNVGGILINNGTVDCQSGATVDCQAGATVDFAGANQTVPGGENVTYHHLITSGSGTKTLAGDAALNGNLAIGAGTILDVSENNYLISLDGNWQNDGAFTARESDVRFGGATPQTIRGNSTFFTLTIDKDDPANTVDASGSTLEATNGLAVTVGVFTSASAFNHVLISPLGTFSLSGDITVSGDWMLLLLGTFNHNNHTVTLNGTDQYLSGNTTFYNLTKEAGAPATLEFEAESTTTVTNALTLKGASGQLLSLRSDDPGTQWKIDPQGTRDIAYVDVQDSNNTNTSAANAGEGSISSGNNANWLFYPTVTTQAVADIGTTTAIGNGAVTDLGIPDPTAHGVCWNTTGDPDIEDDDCTNEGVASTTGAFSSDIADLTPGTTYYIRTYAMNTAGTAYGNQEEFKSKVALTMAASPAGGGTTEPTAGSTTDVDADVAQNITATANGSYNFVTWTANPAGNATFGNASNPETTVSLTGSATVTANFAINTYTLTTAANPAAGGSVAKSPDKTSYDHGEEIAVTASAKGGYTFTGWSGDLSGTTNPANLTMDGNKSVTANLPPLIPLPTTATVTPRGLRQWTGMVTSRATKLQSLVQTHW